LLSSGLVVSCVLANGPRDCPQMLHDQFTSNLLAALKQFFFSIRSIWKVGSYCLETIALSLTARRAHCKLHTAAQLCVCWDLSKRLTFQPFTLNITTFKFDHIGIQMLLLQLKRGPLGESCTKQY
jgi:hypothetical protein